MTLPTLTWVQGAKFSTGSATPTQQQVIDAIDAALAAATYWEKKTEGSNYIEIGPKSGSAIANFRAIVSNNPTTGYASPDTTATGVWFGINPSGGTLSSYTSATPYGGGVRFSGYWRCEADAITENVYLIESDEILAIVFMDDSAEVFHICCFGALFVPADGDTIGAESNGRIYGMFTSGSTAIASGFWGTTTGLMRHGTSATQAHVGCFQPDSPSTWHSIDCHLTTGDLTTVTSRGGYKRLLPLYYTRTSSPTYEVGRLRQIYAFEDTYIRNTISNAAMTVIGYTVADAVSPSTADSIIFANA